MKTTGSARRKSSASRVTLVAQRRRPTASVLGVGSRARASQSAPAGGDSGPANEVSYGAGPANEITFSVLETFTHDSFDLRKRSVRTREENGTEICSVVNSRLKQRVFLGLSSGDILALHYDFTPGQLQNAPVQVLQEHSGAVHCLGILESEGLEAKPRGACTLPGVATAGAEIPLSGVGAALGGPFASSSSVDDRADCWLVSGSSDRSLKVWTLKPKEPNVVKTLVGHSGTVVALQVQIPFLFSAATDGSLFIWTVDLKSKQVPVLTLIQKYVGGNLVPANAPKLAALPSHSWFGCINSRWSGKVLKVYAGSTDGSLLLLEGTLGSHSGIRAGPAGNSPLARRVLNAEEASVGSTCWNILEGAQPFSVVCRQPLHSLAIRAVLGLSVESAVVTAGGDGSIVVSDPSKQQVGWRFSNAEAAAFSSLQWDCRQGLLLVGDDSGSIHAFNIYSNERVAEQQICTARVAFLLEDPENEVCLVVTPNSVFLMKAEPAAAHIKVLGHRGRQTLRRQFEWTLYTGAISHLLWVSVQEQSFLLSVSTDLTMRLWDLDRAVCVQVISCRHSEVTSVTYLQSLDTLITGHEDGAVRFWPLPNETPHLALDKKGKALHSNTVAAMDSWEAALPPPSESFRKAERQLVREAGSEAAQSGSTRQLLATCSVGSKRPQYILTGGYDGRVCLLLAEDLEDHVIVKQTTAFEVGEPEEQEVLFVAAAPQKGVFFRAGNGRRIYEHSLEDGALTAKLEGHSDASVACRTALGLWIPQDSVTALKIAEGLLASASVDKTVRLWRVDSLVCVCTLSFPVPQTLLLPLPSPGVSGGEWASVSRQGEVSFFRGGNIVGTPHQVEATVTSAVRVQGQRVMLAGTVLKQPLSHESSRHSAQRTLFLRPLSALSEAGEIVAVPLPQPEIRPVLQHFICGILLLRASPNTDPRKCVLEEAKTLAQKLT